MNIQLKDFDRRSLALVVGLALIGSLAFQGSRGLYHTTEGRYTCSAYESLQSGNYVVPLLDGEPHWTKPPLTYLAIMLSMRLFGETPWGVRAFLVFAMLGCAVSVWRTGTRLWGANAGRWAGIVFASSPFMVATAHVVATDMLVVLWTALSIGAFWSFQQQNRRVAFVLLGLFLGLALLTKGPPALLVPGSVLLTAWVALQRVGRARRVGVGLFLIGLGLFLLVGLGWYVWAIWRFPEYRLARYWIGQELVGRNLQDTFSRNPGFGFVFSNYLPILLFGTGHWLLLVLFFLGRDGPAACCRRLFLLRRGGFNDAVRVALLLGGVMIPFLVFALSRSKLPLYLAPLFVPLSLLLGRGIDGLIDRGRLNARRAGVSVAVLMLVVLIAKAIYALPDRDKDMTHLAARIEPVIERVQPDVLYSVSGRHLSGLAFHLKRPVTHLRPEAFETQLSANERVGRHGLYILSSRHARQFLDSIGEDVDLQLESFDTDWSCLWRSSPPAESEHP